MITMQFGVKFTSQIKEGFFFRINSRGTEWQSEEKPNHTLTVHTITASQSTSSLHLLMEVIYISDPHSHAWPCYLFWLLWTTDCFSCCIRSSQESLWAEERRHDSSWIYLSLIEGEPLSWSEICSESWPVVKGLDTFDLFYVAVVSGLWTNQASST